jgi:hypothetical protein
MDDLLIDFGLPAAQARMAIVARPWRIPKPPEPGHDNECDQLRLRVRAFHRDERMRTSPTIQSNSFYLSLCHPFAIYLRVTCNHPDEGPQQRRTKDTNSFSIATLTPASIAYTAYAACKPTLICKHLLYGSNTR